MHRRWFAIVTAVIFLTLGPRPAQAQQSAAGQDIVGIIGTNGRTVLTNMGAAVPPASPRQSAVVSPYLELIDSISERYGVDPRLTRAVIEVESGFDPYAISARGALGLMQLIPDTGERFGVNNFFDPADNIRGGVPSV